MTRPSWAKPSDRLLRRLRAMGVPVPANPEFRRTYAGYQQRNAGAWSWYMVDADTGAEAKLGSQYPVKELLRSGGGLTAGYDIGGDIHIDPNHRGPEDVPWNPPKETPT